MNEKLDEIYGMVDFILDEDNSEDIDTITLYQGQLPYLLREIVTDIRTMFE